MRLCCTTYSATQLMLGLVERIFFRMLTKTMVHSVMLYISTSRAAVLQLLPCRFQLQRGVDSGTECDSHGIARNSSRVMWLASFTKARKCDRVSRSSLDVTVNDHCRGLKNKNSQAKLPRYFTSAMDLTKHPIFDG